MRITVTQQKEEFKPFVLSLEIESEDELIELYNRFNVLEEMIKEDLGVSYRKHSSRNAYEIFQYLKLKLLHDNK